MICVQEKKLIRLYSTFVGPGLVAALALSACGLSHPSYGSTGAVQLTVLSMMRTVGAAQYWTPTVPLRCRPDWDCKPLPGTFCPSTAHTVTGLITSRKLTWLHAHSAVQNHRRLWQLNALYPSAVSRTANISWLISPRHSSQPLLSVQFASRDECSSDIQLVGTIMNNKHQISNKQPSGILKRKFSQNFECPWSVILAFFFSYLNTCHGFYFIL